MSDPAEIFLQPECCAVPGEGRLWCEHDAPEDCEDGVPWTRYVHADQIDRLRRELAEARGLLGSLVAYTEACEGLLNASPAGQVAAARAFLAEKP